MRVSREYVEALKYKLVWVSLLFLALVVMLQQIVLYGLVFPSKPIPESFYFSVDVIKAGLLVLAFSLLYDVYKEVMRWRKQSLKRK